MVLFIGCTKTSNKKTTSSKQYITVLGIAQDGGYPHIGCQKTCCQSIYKGLSKRKSVVSLGLIDQELNGKWIFEATPDVSTQLADLEQNHLKKDNLIDGVFLTHAHIGHYTGLMYFGKEALGKKGTTVYAMPNMKNYLETSGPWSQLVELENIRIKELQQDSIVDLNSNVKVIPFLYHIVMNIRKRSDIKLLVRRKPHYSFRILTNGKNGVEILLKK